MVDWTAPSQANVDAYFKDLNNWGRWGDDDQLGTANTITLEKQAAAQALVRSGRTVSLARHIVAQPALTYYVTYPSQRESADIVVDRFGLVFHGYSVTHIDALCHVGFKGELYNGRSFKESFSRDGAKWCPIDPLFGGLSTRGVLLDVAAGRKEGYVAVGKPVTPPDLDAAAARAGVSVGAWRRGGGAQRSGAVCTGEPGLDSARLAASRLAYVLHRVVSRQRHCRDCLGHDGRAPHRLCRLRHGDAHGDSVSRLDFGG